jgi:small-conductance mechanosensitive channel
MEPLQVFWQNLMQNFGGYVPSLIAALAILLVGWLVALAVSAGVRALLRRTKLDNKLTNWVAGDKKGEPIPAERYISKGVFYLIMLFVLIAFFQALGLTVITQPLNGLLNQAFTYAPRLLGAGALILVAWILASVLRFLVTKALTALKIDERLGDQAGMDEEERMPLSKTLGSAVYWLVFLLFLPAVLNALALDGLLEPVQVMFNNALGYLPNILGAGLILAVGWFVARIVQRILGNLLAAVGVDRLVDRVGLDKAMGKQKLSGLIALIVYVLILIPVLIAALNALALDAITDPATNMLDRILAAFPAVFGAALVLAIAYFVGRLVSGLITNLLAGMGFDHILSKLGLGKDPEEGQQTPSQIVGYLILVLVMLFASIEALRLMEFGAVADMVTRFTGFAGQIVLGLVIFAIGLFLANLAAKTIQSSGSKQSGMLALAARVAILVLAGAMALREMGLADDIINLAFGMLLGAIAVAVALAFGLGGRKVAARELESWVESAKKDQG